MIDAKTRDELMAIRATLFRLSQRVDALLRAEPEEAQSPAPNAEPAAPVAKPPRKARPAAFWTPERVAELRALIAAGKSDPEAARHFGKTPMAILKARRRFDIEAVVQPVGQPRRDPELIEKVRRRIAAGKTVPQIADALGMTRANVYDICRRNKISLGGKSAAKKANGATGGRFRGRAGAPQHTKAPCAEARPAAEPPAVEASSKGADPRPNSTRQTAADLERLKAEFLAAKGPTKCPAPSDVPPPYRWDGKALISTSPNPDRQRAAKARVA